LPKLGAPQKQVWERQKFLRLIAAKTAPARDVSEKISLCERQAQPTALEFGWFAAKLKEKRLFLSIRGTTDRPVNGLQSSL
jgi:hypothetical protein